MSVLVLGGTTESRTLAQQLARHEIPAIISVATRYGLERLERQGFDEADSLELRSGRLDPTELQQLLEMHNVSEVIDATHPYAEVISKIAAQVTSEKSECTFVRLKRPRANLPEHDLIQHASSSGEAARQLSNLSKRILLTTGTANLDQFASQIDPARLFARVLPFDKSITACREAGLLSSHIIAMQGPFSTELNRATYRQYEIERIVTKRSGPASGVKQKTTAAIDEQLGITLIERPDLPPADEQFVDHTELVRWLLGGC